MRFGFDTAYDQRTMTAMARALRKTVREKRSRRAHIFGAIAIVLGLALTLVPGENGFEVDLPSIVTWTAAAVMLFALICEDSINGFFAAGRLLKGTERASSVFSEEGFVSTTEIGKTEWNYDKIAAIAETERYFVFVFSQNHAQAYDKNSISGGTADEFRDFIQRVTGRDIRRVK